MMILIILTVWIAVGLLGMVADSIDRVGLSYGLLTAYLIFIPFIPWVLHWCGLF